MRREVRATYRVQLTPTFGFDDAAAVVGYLADLGVSHLYTSPLFEATPGSAHGYDITDHQRVREELGGDGALRRLWEELAHRGMGHIIDLVPNHMGIRSATNRWWQDVLAEGPASRYANHFDIDWSPDGPGQGRLVLPFLGRPLATLVRDGEVTIERRSNGQLIAHHHADRWPLSAESVKAFGADLTDVEEMTTALGALHRAPDRLMELLDGQHWQAVPWREGADRLNWRRFFDVTDLAAVQVERPEVFDDMHGLLRSWLTDDPLAAQVVHGVRVDHVDGLVDPQDYLERLRDLVGPDRLLVVEKILAADESCPAGWPVDGTTGYEVMARLDEVLTPRRGAESLTAAYGRHTGDERTWAEVEATSRQLIIRDLLVPETRRAAAALRRAVLVEAPELDPTLGDCVDIVGELAGAFTVYRVYARPGSTGSSAIDAMRVDTAADRVRRRRPDLDGGLLNVTVALLAGRRGRGSHADEMAIRFAQLSAPLAAKAVEDTAFYRWAPCAWLNEVGGDPARLGPPTAELHRLLATTGEHHPGGLAPITTHDTKRSGDVRARLGRLAEVPEAFAAAVAKWREAIGTASPLTHTERPDPALEWLLWQSLVGAWPMEPDRAAAYAVKAAREAKGPTSWIDPDPAFERGLVAFVELVLADPELAGSVAAFAAMLRRAGRAASLTQITLAATAVGVPDVYQGDELWNLSLVDPDNRRPVDWGRLRTVSDEVSRWAGPELATQWATTQDLADDAGAVKLAVVQRLLRLRSGAQPLLRRATDYRPQAVAGREADAVFAFARGDDLIVVAPRRFMTPVTAAIDLPAGDWIDALTDVQVTGGRHSVAELTASLPVAVLVRRR